MPKHCLVVDDSAVIRKVRGCGFSKASTHDHEAEDGSKALDVCHVHMPDAILLDWNMPVMEC